MFIGSVQLECPGPPAPPLDRAFKVAIERFGLRGFRLIADELGRGVAQPQVGPLAGAQADRPRQLVIIGLRSARPARRRAGRRCRRSRCGGAPRGDGSTAAPRHSQTEEPRAPGTRSLPRSTSITRSSWRCHTCCVLSRITNRSSSRASPRELAQGALEDQGVLEILPRELPRGAAPSGRSSSTRRGHGRAGARTRYRRQTAEGSTSQSSRCGRSMPRCGSRRSARNRRSAGIGRSRARGPATRNRLRGRAPGIQIPNVDLHDRWLCWSWSVCSAGSSPAGCSPSC